MLLMPTSSRVDLHFDFLAGMWVMISLKLSKYFFLLVFFPKYSPGSSHELQAITYRRFQFLNVK